MQKALKEKKKVVDSFSCRFMRHRMDDMDAAPMLLTTRLVGGYTQESS